MVVDFNIKNFFDGFFNRLYSRITEFDHFSGIGHDDMNEVMNEG